MKKWLSLCLVVLIALATYVGAGPYLTVRAIRTAVKEQDTTALAKQIDFPALRASLKAQLLDAIVRKAGEDVQANPIGAFALTMASGVVNGVVDAMVTPTGLAGVMEGRKVWRNARDSFNRPQTDENGEPIPEPEPLHDARYRYESLSRFTATIEDDSGEPIVFVLRRQGLQWKLVDIRLPMDGNVR